MAAKVTARQREAHREVWLANVRAIRLKRAARNITVTQVARDLNRNYRHVYDVLRGRTTSEKMARDIAEYFETPVEDLFQRIDLENPDKASAA